MSRRRANLSRTLLVPLLAGTAIVGGLGFASGQDLFQRHTATPGWAEDIQMPDGGLRVSFPDLAQLPSHSAQAGHASVRYTYVVLPSILTAPDGQRVAGLFNHGLRPVGWLLWTALPARSSSWPCSR